VRRRCAATVHGFTVAFWYGTAIFTAAAVFCTKLVRPGTRTGATSNPMEIEVLANLEAAGHEGAAQSPRAARPPEHHDGLCR
jgi:hypothetical protein